ncbi:MAG: PASTA domain-containing protein [Firmicutes bacterium]|nr:PASTA domain-containing protein [Bacillota bacterium]
MYGKRNEVGVKSRKRALLVFGLLSVIMIGLLFRTAWIQIVHGDEYTEMAKGQQKTDMSIQAKRGSIYARNGEQLATSVTCYTLWLRPAQMREDFSEDERAEIALKLAAILGQDVESIKTKFRSEDALMKLAKNIDKEMADQVAALDIPAIDVVEGTRRRYPQGTLAATVLGSVSDDGIGRSGIEYMYNEYLSGVAGRSVRNTDVTGNSLAFGENKYYAAQDGLNVELTIDPMLQQYLDASVRKGAYDYKAERVEGIVMNPNTGEVLAMSIYPTFDPNDPLEPTDLPEEQMAAYEEMDDDEKTAFVFGLWRNQLINDVYEPGSTLKLVTASASIEEGFSTPDRMLNCQGSTWIEDVEIYDAEEAIHGDLTLTQAVGMSCNQVHMFLAREMGLDNYYKYVDLYGLNEITGIDYPAESGSIIYEKEDVGPVELASMGFGQSIAITPIQLITAVSAIANEGVLMKPHLVNRLTDEKGETVVDFKPQEVRKVISEQTAREMLSIMEQQVELYGGNGAYIPGYRIGGKTGTADQTENGVYTGNRDMSFISVVPVNNPQIVTLIICHSPKKGEYGSETAIPITREFYLQALPYLQAGTQGHVVNDSTQVGEKVYVPDITGYTFQEAKQVLEDYGLQYEVRPELSLQELKDADFVVVDQYPKGGKTMEKDEKVYIYRE